ncbi:MAG: DUF2279 domain-containing protein [Bacteroidales bacterium]|nr:DUF2279 domain-containing protein [Bacteroidales bacterium]
MKLLILFIFSSILNPAYPQEDSSSFGRNKKILFISGFTAAYGISVIGMNQLWYKNYEHSSFHWIDDSHEWQQMDKAGHSYSAYMSSRIIYNSLHSAGMSNRHALLFSSGAALLGISTVEVFDGFSAGWGASASDLIANTSGIGFFALQEAICKEEKIFPKFSWHSTPYAAMRTDVLGRNSLENILKDYNGQTYWLSFNLKSLSGYSKLPLWLCLSLGYGAEGMTGGSENPSTLPYYERYRQYYLSLDADLSKIPFHNKTLVYIFRKLNFIKVPFPALEFSRGGFAFRPLYF